MDQRRVAVVGAGAAGLTAALRAAEAGAHVTLFNAHPRIGLKILMSGGTRCNVTHREVSERDFHGGSRHVIARMLRAFTVPETLAWFESLGVALKLEDTGKYFPVTDDAHTVLDALLGAVRRAGVEVVTGARVLRLVPPEQPGPARSDAAAGRVAPRARGGSASMGAGAAVRAAVPWRLGVQRVADSAALGAAVRAPGATEWLLPAGEPEAWSEAKAVVLATGGLSFPRTGSDGTGYALALALGHTLVPPVPALTPLASDDLLCGAAQGMTCEAELALQVGGERAATARGSLLFAHFGLSGPAALDLSRHWHRAEGSAREVVASFLPGETPETLAARWVRVAGEAPRGTVRRFLSRDLAERLVEALCEETGVDPGAALSQVPRARRDALVRVLLARPMRVTGTLGYEKAEVTAGGVPLSEVDASTLESRVTPGLFLCGEVLDVEGRLGGFNFQWAWSSGTVAGRAAATGPTPEPTARR
jgi:hypothetical protein